MHPGENRDGYITNQDICDQLVLAIGLAKAKYPEAEHIFIYDNATTHTKRRDDALSACQMTLKPSANFGVASTGPNGDKVKIRMANAKFADGSPQDLHFPDTHAKFPGQFKGVTKILEERGIDTTGLKLQCSQSKCKTLAQGEVQSCCARRILFNQPDFMEQKSSLEELAEAHGCSVLLLPKFHCELNPIEQCWGCAKRVYRQFPPSKSKADLKANMLASLNSVPIESIRRSVVLH